MKPCVHPQFVELAGEAGKRACVKCGEFLDDIVQASSHPECAILHGAEPREHQRSLTAAQRSAAPLGESTRANCIELPRVRQAAKPLPRYNDSLAARPHAEVMPLPVGVEKPRGEALNPPRRTRRPRLYVSPVQRALLERLRAQYPKYLACVFEHEVRSALMVDIVACERLLTVVPLSGRTGHSLYRKVANLLDVVRRQEGPSLDHPERIDGASGSPGQCERDVCA